MEYKKALLRRAFLCKEHLRQNAEKIIAKTPKKLLPKRRKNYYQNAENILYKTPKI